MNARQSQLAKLIRRGSLEPAADAGDFAAIANQLNAASITITREDPVSMGETGLALGSDVAGVLQAFEATATGRSALAKLSAAGLRYHHPLTQALLAGLVAAGLISQTVSDQLTALSTRVVSPAEHAGLDPVTATELQTAWTLYRLDQRIQNAAALMAEYISAEMSRGEQLAAAAKAWTNAGKL